MRLIINAIGSFTHLVYSPIYWWWSFLAVLGTQSQEFIVAFFSGKIDESVGFVLLLSLFSYGECFCISA
ncbi:MAG: hypothetical protein LIO92_07110 [Clostridiales bacterium]|nr:hypothetical protein [Clostridiales bacterium]